MPEPALNDGQLDAGLEQASCIAVTKGVDAAGLADSGPVLGSSVDMPGPMTGQRASEQLIGEQPGLGTLATPVLAELFQQPRRERNVAVLVALALFDAQRHPFGIDIAEA